MPNIDPISIPVELSLGDISMFTINSAVFSKGEWNFGITNNLFFDLNIVFLYQQV